VLADLKDKVLFEGFFPSSRRSSLAFIELDIST
jgi:hypothetical protein